MKPIRPGDRGPAVEDIQRRLRALGHDLGPTGVDGVFLGKTAEAVRAFQSAAHLAEDALVGDETWAALVDETFTLGDRMLYLRLPHFHGRDVRVLQQALNSLGFPCGAIDGILGSFTERAIADFQRNAGLVADGIAGDETVGAITALRHVWEGKDPRSHSAATASPNRAAAVLERITLTVRGLDPVGEDVASRVVNLAKATTPLAGVEAGRVHDEQASRDGFVLELGCGDSATATPGRAVVRLDEGGSLASRLVTAVESYRRSGIAVVVDVGAECLGDERVSQRAAVSLLDAVCAAFD